MNRKQLSILEVNTENTWRGGERQTWYDLLAWQRLGHQPVLLCLKNSPLCAKAAELDIPIIPVGSQVDIFFHLARYAGRYDVVHVQTAKALSYAALARTFRKTCLVATRRVDFIPSGQLTRWKYNRCDGIVCISSAIESILKGFQVKHLFKIGDIAEAKKLDDERARQWLNEKGIIGKKILGTTSALVPHKDPLNMVRAVAELSRSRSDFVFLHFGDGELKQATTDEIKRKELDHLYLLPGFTPNVEDFFSVFDGFCMSSCEEGLGSSVLDAFIYKVPVASTTAGGLAEIVGSRGWLAPPSDPHLLAQAMNKLLDDSPEREEKIESAHTFVKEHHSVEAIGKAYENLFFQLISG